MSDNWYGMDWTGWTGNVERLKLMHDLVLIKRDPRKESSSGGIYFADRFRKPSYTGTVVSVGPGRWKDSNKFVHVDECLQPGTRVWYAAASGRIVNEDYVVMREEDILALVED